MVSRQCSFESCDRPPKTPKQPLCNTHYRQQLRGQPLRPFRQMRSSAEVEAELAQGLRTCCDCDRQLPTSEFHRSDTHGRGLASTCKTCGLSRRRKNKYGITTPEWEALLGSQGHRCAICKTDDPGKSNWHTDHDHDTGDVRGILCMSCNNKLGHHEKWYLPNRLAVDAYLNPKVEV